MFEKIRSLIFKFDPETAHDLAIKALKTKVIPVKSKRYDSSQQKRSKHNCKQFFSVFFKVL